MRQSEIALAPITGEHAIFRIALLHERGDAPWSYAIAAHAGENVHRTGSDGYPTPGHALDAALGDAAVLDAMHGMLQRQTEE